MHNTQQLLQLHGWHMTEAVAHVGTAGMHILSSAEPCCVCLRDAGALLNG